MRLFETPWTVALQAPLSMGFSRQECWSGFLFPSPGDLPDPGIKPRFSALQVDSSLTEPLQVLDFGQTNLVSIPLRCLLVPPYLWDCVCTGLFTSPKLNQLGAYNKSISRNELKNDHVYGSYLCECRSYSGKMPMRELLEKKTLFEENIFQTVS